MRFALLLCLLTSTVEAHIGLAYHIGRTVVLRPSKAPRAPKSGNSTTDSSTAPAESLATTAKCGVLHLRHFRKCDPDPIRTKMETGK